MVSFLGDTAHESKSTQLRPRSRTFPSSCSCFHNLSHCTRSITVVSPPIRFYSNPTFSSSILPPHPIVTPSLVAPAFNFPFVSSTTRWVANAPPRITNEQRRRMTEYLGGP